ncbi:hypothetical protein PHYC_03405 [Phycisphaerales bacterium]|nr:hypothetical protein PHYC_03405 [Phycisphaerales bacterium]
MARLLVAVMVSVLVCGAAVGQTVFTTPTTIEDGDLTYDGLDIVIRGTTVTINGAHAFNSIVVERNGGAAGVLTHGAGFTNGTVNGAFITVATDMTVQGSTGGVASRVDVSGRGAIASDGLGAGGDGATVGTGAGHGGAGGLGSVAAAAPGGCYGSVSQPTDFGSGGGNDADSAALGGAGGGVLRLVVNGVLTVDGSITAAGLNRGGASAGGGSGGSLWLSCGTLAGVGSIASGGGTSDCCTGGGGGGGRIAVYADVLTYSGTVSAAGGTGAQAGGAGTGYVKIGAGPGTITIDNAGRANSGLTEFAGATTLDANVVVRAQGKLGPPTGAVLDLTVTGDLTVETASFVTCSGRGHPASAGPGEGGDGATIGAGAGHGGAGGVGSVPGVAPGGCYGSVFQPVMFGSGGGDDADGAAFGGAGGGAIKLTVAGALTLDGAVAADGLARQGANAGGGAGGSLWVSCAMLSGVGSFTANGGASDCCFGGGGGGGRIAVYFDGSTFAGTFATAGGGGAQRGAAGTVFTKPSAGRGTIVVDNGDSVSGAMTEFAGVQVFDANLIVRNQGRVGHPTGSALDLTLLGDVSVETDGIMDVSGRGYAASTGPGEGGDGATVAAGAGHGGAGGLGSQPTDAYGGCYGSLLEPEDFGSGGGNDLDNGPALGGAGGGALKLTIDGSLVCDGVIASDGLARGSHNAGGGSGGSLWVSCGALSGAGSFHANGGASDCCFGGGGGGGRVAVYYATSSFTGVMNATGGTGAQAGAGGTIFTKPDGGRGTIIVDNADRVTAAMTEMSGIQSYDANLRVRNQGRLGHPFGAPLDLTLDGDVAVEAGGIIDVSGRGHPASEGPGVGGDGGEVATGGGHGGAGGAGAAGYITDPPGGCYGSVLEPVTFGSGGGNDLDNGPALGGAGGGALRLSVGGSLGVDGIIASDGMARVSHSAGGGAGGSLRISCDTFSGSATGVVRANGGNSDCCFGGGGGGGRVAIYYTTSTFAGQVQTKPGTGAIPGGAGTAFLKAAAARGTIVVDSGGIVTPNVAELAGTQVFDADLIVRNQGKLGPPAGQVLALSLQGDLTVEATGAVTADGRGFVASEGPGAGGDGLQIGSGAGYGGRGGNGAFGFTVDPPGEPYGNDAFPVDFGSGGGNDGDNGPGLGGAGGGALELNVGGAVTVNGTGTISANGFARAAGSAGGGSGGSIMMKAGAVTGTGTIRAGGGTSDCCFGGGGGGGRIAIYSCTLLLPQSNITAPGGTGANAGAAGTVVFGGNSVEITQQPVDVVAGENQSASFTVAATGNGALTYQWRRNNVPLSDGCTYDGANAPTLVIPQVRPGMGGRFDCIVTDSCGSFPSRAALLTIPQSSCDPDVNCDGGLNGFDIEVMEQAVNGDYSNFCRVDESCNVDADYNRDGTINGFDVEAIEQSVNGAPCP